MRVSHFTRARRELQKIYDCLVARRSVLLEERLALNPRLLRNGPGSNHHGEHCNCQYRAGNHGHSPVFFKSNHRANSEGNDTQPAGLSPAAISSRTAKADGWPAQSKFLIKQAL